MAQILNLSFISGGDHCLFLSLSHTRTPTLTQAHTACTLYLALPPSHKRLSHTPQPFSLTVPPSPLLSHLTHLSLSLSQSSIKVVGKKSRWVLVFGCLTKAAKQVVDILTDLLKNTKRHFSFGYFDSCRKLFLKIGRECPL